MTRETSDKKRGAASSFRLTLTAGMLAALVLAMPTTASAGTTPGIALVSVQCLMGGGTPPEMLTVQVNFDSAVFVSLKYEFRNVASGQTITYSPVGSALIVNLPVPPGTYNLTVKQPSGQHSQSLWTNIVVPHAVSTNGKGTGCRFLSLGETPASVPVTERH